MDVSTPAIVLRTADYGDYNRMLTLLSPTQGKISAAARGCRRPGAKLLGATQLFQSGEYFFAQRGERYTLTQFVPGEGHYPLRMNLQTLTVAMYMANLCEEAAQPAQADPELYALLLDALRVLAYTDRSAKSTLTHFQVQYLKHLGYTPMMQRCAACGGLLCGEADGEDPPQAGGDLLYPPTLQAGEDPRDSPAPQAKDDPRYPPPPTFEGERHTPRALPEAEKQPNTFYDLPGVTKLPRHTDESATGHSVLPKAEDAPKKTIHYPLAFDTRQGGLLCPECEWRLPNTDGRFAFNQAECQELIALLEGDLSGRAPLLQGENDVHLTPNNNQPASATLAGAVQALLDTHVEQKSASLGLLTRLGFGAK